MIHSKDILSFSHPACSDAPFIETPGNALSRAGFFQSVVEGAEELRSLGVRPADRVGVCGRNSVEYVLTLFALWRVGAVACLLSPRLPAEARNQQADSVDCKIIVSPDGSSDGSTARPKFCQNIFQRGDPGPSTPEPNMDFPLNHDATIVFTSGSSGRPKPALHTISNHYFNALGCLSHMPLSSDDAWLLSLPLYHVGGLGIVFRTWLSGAKIFVPHAADSLEDVVSSSSVTHLSLVATQLIRLLRIDACVRRLKRMKAVVVGGGPVPPGLVEEAIAQGIALFVSYGLTEMASQVATSDRLVNARGPYPARVLKHRHVRISDEGEILVRGQALFKGYVDGHDCSLPLTADGYFKTGDLGYLTGQGLLVVTGRKDFMFISGGENIQPEEIEQVLLSFEGVEDALVVPIKDDEFGHRPVAFLKSNQSLRSQRLRMWLRSRLPGFKVPKIFCVWPDPGLTAEELKRNRERFRCLVEQGRHAPIP